MHPLQLGTWVTVAPETVQLGFEPRGVIDDYRYSHGWQYRLCFSDGSLRWLDAAQIAGPE